MTSNRVLQLSIGDPAQSGQVGSSLTAALNARGYDLETHFIAKTSKPMMVAELMKNTPRFSKYAAVITTEYTLTFAAGLRATTTGDKTPIIAVGMNLSGAALRTGFPPFDATLNAAFKRVDLSIVHSRHEAAKFQRLHKLDNNKLAFAHWGFDLPEFSDVKFASKSNYVCLIGRNNRDFETFCSAVSEGGVHGVIIAPDYAELPSDIPANIDVYRDLPFDDCLSCIRHADANIILIKDDNRGAGHITAVAAMLLGVPQIYTDASVLSDYLINGVTGIAAPIGDANAVARSIKSIRDEATKTTKIKTAARDYALRWLSHEAAAKRQVELITAILERRPIDFAEPAWLSAYNSLSENSAIK